MMRYISAGRGAVRRRRQQRVFQEAHAVHAMRAVAHDPVQVRTRDPAARPDTAYHLAPLDDVSHRHVLRAQMQVRRDEPGAVIQVDDAAAEIEFVDERYDSACRCAYRRTDGTGEVGARMTALHLVVERAAVAEAAGDAALARRQQRRLPEPRGAVRTL